MPLFFASAITPMISNDRILDGVSVLKLLHLLHDDLTSDRISAAKYLLTNVWLTTATLRAVLTSVADSVRPRKSFKPSVRNVAVAAELVDRLPSFGVCLARNVDVGADAAIGRKRRRFGGRHNTRQRVQPRQQRLEELLLRRRGLVLLARQRQARDEDVVRIEPEIDRLQLHEVAHQQSRAGQQHERERDFAHHERASELAAPESADDAAARVLQRIGHVFLRRLQRGHEPEHDGREHRDARLKASTGMFRRMIASVGNSPSGMSPSRP